MKSITGEEFCELIKKDPSWCLSLKEKLEITSFVNLKGSEITHLSPFLIFSKRSKLSATFWMCKNLKVATGTFQGYVDFTGSGIEKIENLTVKGTTDYGESANFSECSNLKVATGTYEGFVQFSDSGIETIKDLIIKNTDTNREKAHFYHCPIQYVPKEYRGEEYQFDIGVIENSIRKDIRDYTLAETIRKIKSETNNIEL